MDAFLAPLAFAFERYLGYPQRLLDSVGHPVVWFGRLIGFLDRKLNRPDQTASQRRESGIVTLLVLLLVGLVASILVMQLTRAIPFGWVIEALVAVPFLASRQLADYVRRTADALGISLDAGREAVSHIVGRDTAKLDEAGVSRAAIETLAENASDGVIAPLFWLALLGLPGIVLYKAVNTADSMIGHLDDRYRDFGWASARFDDLVNWIPARLTAGLIVAAAFLMPGASPTNALRAARRDAPHHHSPNAGWPEAAMAGALDFGLGGPRDYSGELVDLPRMGNGRRDLTPTDIRRALRLYDIMLILALALSILVAALRMAI